MSNLNDLTKDELITYIESIYEKLDNIESVIGDTPVSEQVSIALSSTASKKCVQGLIDEFNILKNKVESLIDLVGDTPVAEQISNATMKGDMLM